MKGNVIVVDDDQFTRKLVTETLKNSGNSVVSFESGTKLLREINDQEVDLIVLDVMMPELDGFETCQRLRVLDKTKNTPILMLTAVGSLDEKLKGFDAGADDYMVKPFEPKELQARAQALMKRAPIGGAADQELTSKTLAVFSLRGGVGVSSLAVNCAAGLAKIWEKPVVLVDLAVLSGHSALMVNTPIKNTWADLARLPIEEINLDLINSVLLPHSSGLNVLAAPKKAEETEILTGELVKHVLSILSRSFEYMVIDLPSNFDPITVSALDLASEILYVMAPDLASIRATSSALNTFDALGYSRDKYRLILNWIFEKRGLAQKDIEEVLRTNIDLIIPFSSDRFVTAINLGNPPVLDSPDQPLGALLEDLAFFLSKDEHRKKRPKDPSEAWKRVVERYKKRRK